MRGHPQRNPTWHGIDFQNRIFYLGPQTPAGPNYLIPGGGAYFNAGGIDTTGIELSATVPLPHQTAFYTAYRCSIQRATRRRATRSLLGEASICWRVLIAARRNPAD